MGTDAVSTGRKPITVAALFYGLLLVAALLVVVAPFGVGTPELLVWLALMVGWVAYWTFRRRSAATA